MIFLTFFIFLVLSPTSILADSPSNKAQFIENYRQRDFHKAQIGFSELIRSGLGDDETSYYLALSYSQLGLVAQAVDSYRQLLEKNPTYYNYKVIFDQDFGPVRSAPEFVALLSQYPATYLAQDKNSFDRIAQKADGLYLYRNGMEVLLKEPSGQFWAGFLSNDQLYYAWMQTSVTLEKKKEVISYASSVILYSRKDKKQISLYSGADPLTDTFIQNILAEKE